MKKVILFFAFIGFLHPILPAQDYSREFMKIGKDEIEMKYYTKDTAAEAVVLFDLGDSRFVDAGDYTYDIEFTRTKRIKIFTKAGLSYAEVVIPFYIAENGNSETIKSIEAFCYNWENGELSSSSLNPSTVYVEKINDRWSQSKFVIPNVKPGSIIEYRYVLVSPFHFNLPNWKFQSHIPTLYSKYVVRMIPFYQYTYIVQGTNRLDQTSSVKDPKERVWGTLSRETYGVDVGYGVRFQDLINTFVMKDVPAFRDESYITSEEDYLIKIDFQESKFINPSGGEVEVMSTWPKLIQELLKNDNFGKYLKGASRTAGKILETKINLTGKSQVEKSKAIINYIKSAYKWDEYNSIYCSRSPREFSEQNKGNSAEINLFLVAMLRSAGIDASPVLLSTRSHGKIRSDYPFLHYFNYVVVNINADNQEFLCDGADFYSNYDRIPSKCINDKGLVIKEGDVKWVSLNPGYNSIDRKSVTIDLNPELLKANAKVVIQALEFDADYYKDNFSNDTAKLKKYFIGNGIPDVTRVTTENFANNDLPYILHCDGEFEIEQLNDKLIISPYLGFYPKENKLTQASRTYPIDLTYKNTESYDCILRIPDGYKVLNIPENLTIDNDQVKIMVSYTAIGEKVNISSEYSFKKAVYQPADYTSLKYYFDTIIKKFNEQIILVKS